MVIRTDGSEPEPLPAPHFDSEAANSARPVRPITESEETVVRHRPAPQPQLNYPPAQYYTPAPYAYQTAVAQYPPRQRSAWRSVLVFFLISGAIGLGLAIGYGIAHYRELHAAQPIVAAAAFRERGAEPELEFTLPPEEEPAEVDPDDPDVEITIPIDIPVDDEEAPPARAPRVTRGSDPSTPARPPVADPQADPDSRADNSGDVRQRRVAGSDPRKPANSRTAKTPPDPNRQMRRTRDGIITRIREIFEGKPD